MPNCPLSALGVPIRPQTDRQRAREDDEPPSAWTFDDERRVRDLWVGLEGVHPLGAWGEGAEAMRGIGVTEP